MSRIGFFTLPVPGHLNPSLTLASALRDRRHQVVFFTMVDGIEKIQRAGFETVVFGEQDFSLEYLDQCLVELSQLSGLKAVRYTIDLFKDRDEAALAELPQRLKSLPLDGIVVDQAFSAAAVIAKSTEIPYVTLSNALPLNLDPAVPPVISHDKPSKGVWTRIRHRMLNRVGIHLFQPVVKQLNEFQQRQGLPKLGNTGEVGSELAQLVQIPRAFDFDRASVNEKMYYVGPLHSHETREHVDFPWNRIDPDRPLIYASMGTLQNRIRHVFYLIAKACADLSVQLVISLGGSADPVDFPDLMGDPVVVRFAPQLKVLQHASVCVTHAGLNTAMEALACGVPMLAIPVTNDQPGVAARIDHFGVGRRIKLARLNTAKIKQALESLLNDSVYREHAKAMQSAIQQSGGPTEAASIIERLFAPVRPLSRQQ